MGNEDNRNPFNNGDSNTPPEATRLAQLKTAQTLTTIGIIAGPVSMLFGGVLLSTIALICAIVAFAKVKKLLEPNDKDGSVARSIYRQAIVALSVSAIALVLNAISLAMILPTMIDVLQNGDIDQLANMYGLSGEGSSSGSSSSSSGGSSSSIWG